MEPDNTFQLSEHTSVNVYSDTDEAGDIENPAAYWPDDMELVTEEFEHVMPYNGTYADVVDRLEYPDPQNVVRYFHIFRPDLDVWALRWYEHSAVDVSASLLEPGDRVVSGGWDSTTRLLVTRHGTVSQEFMNAMMEEQTYWINGWAYGVEVVVSDDAEHAAGEVIEETHWGYLGLGTEQEAVSGLGDPQWYEDAALKVIEAAKAEAGRESRTVRVTVEVNADVWETLTAWQSPEDARAAARGVVSVAIEAGVKGVTVR